MSSRTRELQFATSGFAGIVSGLPSTFPICPSRQSLAEAGNCFVKEKSNESHVCAQNSAEFVGETATIHSLTRQAGGLVLQVLWFLRGRYIPKCDAWTEWVLLFAMGKFARPDHSNLQNPAHFSAGELPPFKAVKI